MGFLFFFLPPIYFIVLISSAIIVGLIFSDLSEKRIIVSTAILFFINLASQLTFRTVLDEDPQRAVGHMLYFSIFLIVVYFTGVAKKRFIGR